MIFILDGNPAKYYNPKLMISTEKKEE